MELCFVDFEVREGIAFVTMNNQEKLNAVTPDGAESLIRCFDYCSDSPEVRCVVLRGAHGNFCGGGDVKMMKYKLDHGIEDTRPGLRVNNRLTRALLTCEKPVVSWLEGAVAGGGLSLALASDFAVADEMARFVFAFVNIGYIPDMGSSLLAARALNRMKLNELVMLGSRFTGAEAAQWGLITRAVPGDGLEAEVMALARKLAAGPTLAYGRMKRLFNRLHFDRMEDAMNTEFEYQYHLCKTHDHEESVRAFFEKRKAGFEGR